MISTNATVDIPHCQCLFCFARHCWSLAVEEQYYLVWPVIFLSLIAIANFIAKALSQRAMVDVEMARKTITIDSATNDARNIGEGAPKLMHLVAVMTVFELMAMSFSQYIGVYVYETEVRRPFRWVIPCFHFSLSLYHGARHSRQNGVGDGWVNG